MLNKTFQFQEYTQKYYSTASYQRFYQKVSKNDQLKNLFIESRSLKKLEKASVNYLKAIAAAFGGSLLLAYSFNKYVKFGTGFTAKIGSIISTLCFMYGGLYLGNEKMKDHMIKTKQKVYEQHEDKLQKYQLTGDILQINSHIDLVQ